MRIATTLVLVLSVLVSGSLCRRHNPVNTTIDARSSTPDARPASIRTATLPEETLSSGKDVLE